MTATAVDAQGNPLAGTSEGIALYDAALDHLVRFDPGVIALTDTLTAQHEEVVMGHALAAYLLLVSTDAGDVAPASSHLQAMRAQNLCDRESAHAAAIQSWLNGDWPTAAWRLDDVLLEWPTDLLALAIGHQLDFFLGDADNLRDRPARSLPAFDPQGRQYGYVLGMAAFGLEESGLYSLSETAGLAALATNRDDVWGTHAVVHTYEMQGRVEEGLEFLESDVSDWETGNLFTVHNWWHYGLFCLETGDTAGALGVYDSHIFQPSATNAPIELLDASALLWRLYLDGTPTGGRFAELSDAWAAHQATTPWYTFNDFHAVMAHAGAERFDAVDEVIDRLKRYLGEGSGSNVAATAAIGLPACRALQAFALERYGETVQWLWPVRRRLHLAGGSHAQRDALQRTLLEAALRSGQHQRARAMIAERLNVRPSSRYAAAQQLRLVRSAGSVTAGPSAL